MYDSLIFVSINIITVLTAGYWMLVALDTVAGMRSVKILAPEKFREDIRYPKVSIIMTAKDEESTIVRSLRTLQGLDYPVYEVIVVNDRSTDRTLEEILAVRREGMELKVITIYELPDGWVGKNHACYRGYRESSGEILLFTDADVEYNPASLRTAIHYFENQKADHLAVSPVIYGESFLLRLFVQYFLYSFLIYFRPWAGGMGVGAFNMFRREAYERIGTHKVISLRPDEDLQLGRLVKRRGLNQKFASGKKLMSVQWYTSLRQAMRGIEKNAFAGLQYNYLIALGAISGQLLFFVFPFIAVIILHGWMQISYSIVLILMVSVYISHISVFSNSRKYDVLFLPLSAVLFIFVVSRALVKTIFHRGIYWRGTFYSLQDLRKM